MGYSALSIGNYIKHNWAFSFMESIVLFWDGKRIRFDLRQQTQRICQYRGYH